MTNMIKMNINISIEDLADFIAEYISLDDVFYVDSVYQVLECSNEVADMAARQFNISRNLMMSIIKDYDYQITKQLLSKRDVVRNNMNKVKYIVCVHEKYDGSDHIEHEMEFTFIKDAVHYIAQFTKISYCIIDQYTFDGYRWVTDPDNGDRQYLIFNT